MQKNLSSARKNYCADAQEFVQKQVNALNKRLFGTGITLKMLAVAIGRDRNTVGNWQNGRTMMSGGDVSAVDQFFRRNGDFDFLTDLFGDTTARRREQAEALERRARELRGGSLEDELDRMERLLARIIEEKRGRAAAE